MERHRGHAFALQLLGETVGAVTGSGEHDRGAGVGNHPCGVLETVTPLHPPEVMGGITGGIVLNLGLMVDRVVLVALGEHRNVAIQRGREEDGLAIGGGHIEETAHRGQKAHVRHPVCFVHHDQIDVTEIDDTLGDQVLQPSGAGDEQVDSLLELGALRAVGHAPVDGEDRTTTRLRQRLQLGDDLVGQLSGRRQDQTAGAAGLAPPETGERGKSEGEGLARPGGRSTGYVPTGQDVRDRDRLDREGIGDVATRQGRSQRLGQAEVGKGGHVGHLSAPRCGAVAWLRLPEPTRAASVRDRRKRRSSRMRKCRESPWSVDDAGLPVGAAGVRVPETGGYPCPCRFRMQPVTHP